ncbi:MAG: PAS domain-containing sensor histidine kinase [Firmicutes bacterium]|nr:PAS domain-containing sensor histidine kinase [Bacillota bacterium]
MRKRTTEWIIILVIIVLFLLLCVFLIREQDRSILPVHRSELNFSLADRNYMREHEQISIYVEKDLRYLIGDGEGGYLQQYLGEVLAPAQMSPVFETGDEKKADASLCVITPQVRAHMQGREYTSPLFQMEGALFLRTGRAPEETIRAVLQEDRLRDSRAEALSYQEHGFSYAKAAGAAEAVALAEKTDADGIIGDRSSIAAELAGAGLQTVFQPREKSIYTINACIIVDSDRAEVHDILDQCIQAADRHNVSFEASQRWLNGSGPVFMDQSYQLTWMPVLIILLSVLIAFFVYYLSNRSMYEELNARMDKITESRNEMQTTFHGVGHLMAELTPGGEITDLNQAFTRGAPAGALHRKIWDVLETDDQSRQRIRRMVEHGARGRQDERFETNLGKQTYVIDVFPVEDARGDVAQLLFMAIDVTQERMAKRQLLQDNKMIAIGQLAAGVAHEIRNPLGIIRNYCYVLKTMEDEEVRAKAIEEIERAVDTSGGIINNLLDFSRISSGRREQIDVEEHVRSLLALNESAYRSKNIELSIVCPEPIHTYMARESFDMILLNLVNNAMDAIADGGRITVRLEKSGEAFVMSVEDTGEGIEEAVLEEIFNPFFTTKGNEGTGLGLYIVYNETEKLDGEIDVSSRRGEGTTFRVRLPIRRPEEKED